MENNLLEITETERSVAPLVALSFMKLISSDANANVKTKLRCLVIVGMSHTRPQTRQAKKQ